jgi:diguanylate cyclase (GGDEF)-like protein
VIAALRRRFPRLVASPAVRISMGMSSLIVAILLAMDLAFGLLPDHTLLVRKTRERIAENLAIEAASLMGSGDVLRLGLAFREQVARDGTILSATVRRSDGQVVTHAGEPPTASDMPADSAARVDHFQVPLVSNGQPWGVLDVRFESAAPRGLRGWLTHPPVLTVLALGFGSFVAFFLYMRRVLAHLDPSTVIPDRVRSAFDVFSGGVMIVDTQSRVMLANAALRGWMGATDTEKLLGRAVDSIPWFARALPADRDAHPWVRTVASGMPVEGEHIEFDRNTASALKVIANTAPILDGVGVVRGCLVTFDNVTHLDILNTQLLASMTELTQTKEEVERKNEELLRLATRDPLTGCLNRRALFEKLDQLFVDARTAGTPLCCIMTDIDHFKSFNDRHGHAVGDQVLQSTSHKLGGGLRDMDLLARYGGEEFCIILPGTTLAQACAVAERLRSDVELLAGASIRSTRDLKVTSSFGVAVLTADIVDPAELIDQADQALYAAKKGGRNCVRTYEAIAEAS